MEQEPSYVGAPSPLKNVVGGSGCGCGCLGALLGLAGAIALAGVPLGFYEGDPTAWQVGGGVAVGVGLLLGLVGAVVWAGSLLLE